MALALVAWLVAAPRPATAQTGATPLGQLESLLPAGTTVVVETIDGRTRKGRLRSVSDSGLVLDTAGAPTVPAESVRTISRRVGRRPWLKGLLVGAGVGGGLGLVAIAEDQRDEHACAPITPSCQAHNGWSAGATAAAITALGAGVGAGIGALMAPPMRVVYRAPGPSRVSIGPFVTHRRRGVALSIAF